MKDIFEFIQQTSPTRLAFTGFVLIIIIGIIVDGITTIINNIKIK